MKDKDRRFVAWAIGITTGVLVTFLDIGAIGNIAIYFISYVIVIGNWLD